MTPGRRWLVAALVAGAIVRVAALPLPGTGDVAIWKVWAYHAARDVTGMYGVGGSPPERRELAWRGDRMTVDYPPVSLYELRVAGRAYAWWDPAFGDTRALNVFVKLPGLAAEVLLVLVLLVWARRELGDEAAAWAAVAFWLNPAVLLDGSVLGYLDAQMAVPLVLAVMAAARGRGAATGALMALAILTKAQAVFALPAVAALLWWPAPADRLRRLGAATGAGLATSVLIVLPFLARGAGPNLAQALGRLATHDALSAQAANLWWIVTWLLRAAAVAGEWGWGRALTEPVRVLGITRAMEIGYPNARVVGLVLVAGAIGWACWRARRAASPADALALAGFSMAAYATLAAQVHENHLYAAVPLLAVAAGLDARYRPWFVGTSLVVALNLSLFYGLGRDVPFADARGWTGIDATVLLSFASVAVLALGVRCWVAGGGGGGGGGGRLQN
ncbi:MAG: hypothetical protein R2752_11465 [Vicinamibacterales bacterium]